MNAQGPGGHRARVVVLDDYQRVALSYGSWERLGSAVDVVPVTTHLADVDELVDVLGEAEIVVAMRERTSLPKEVLERLPNLRLLITTGMMNAVIDMTAAASQGVTVCGTSGIIEPTVELTWALLLSLLRHVPDEDDRVRRGDWQGSVGQGVAGKTIGVLGLGHIGSRVARIAQAFSMSVVAWSQNMTAELAAEHGAELVSKDELFERSDVVTVHLVLSPRSRGLVGAAELRRLGPRGFLVNTSRGPIVDEAALIQALDDGTIAGAALDVFDVEPLPLDHPLRTAKNVVLTPHLGYVTAECYEIFFDHIVEDIAAFLAGEPIRVIVG